MALYTGLAGVALGFLQAGIVKAAVLMAGMSAAAVAVGMYTGYRLGFEYKMRAYVFGGLLLVAGGAGVVLGYM